jgi:hypothetical protein
MMTRTLNLVTRTVVLCAGLLMLAPQSASAMIGGGCKASCSQGSCSTSNKYAECGCCTSGTPYCGNASDCKDQKGATLTSLVFDVVSVGGKESGQVLLDSLGKSLQANEGTYAFLESVRALSDAILSGNMDEARAAEIIAIDRFDGLAEGDDNVALKVVLSSLATPASR